MEKHRLDPSFRYQPSIEEYRAFNWCRRQGAAYFAGDAAVGREPLLRAAKFNSYVWEKVMDIGSQVHQPRLEDLEAIVLKNPILKDILTKLPSFGLRNYYVGAGCVAQSVWNYLSGRNLQSDISDIDIVYFEDADLSQEAEERRSDSVKSLFPQVPLKIDVKNEARVHLWYESRFGYPIKPYQSLEKAIDTWPTTATAIGIRYRLGSFEAYAPYGLDDLFGMVVRPNKNQINEEIYLVKAQRWKAAWPSLKIVPWDYHQRKT